MDSVPSFINLLDETKLWPCLHMTLAVGGTLNTNTQYILELYTAQIKYRVPTSSGKSRQKVPCMEKSWNLKKKLINHGKIMEFCDII